MPSAKTGILLLNMGGPDTPDNVRHFLFNLFSDPDIIRLPFSEIFQKPLAWYITATRAHEARKNYELMGGASPILQWSQAQADAVKAELETRGYGPINVYVAMRYWHPLTADVVDQIIRDGIEQLVVIPLYPHFSYTTTGSSINELKRCLAARQSNIPLLIVSQYANHPIYQKAVAETIEAGLNNSTWSCKQEDVHILFSAHSLPKKHIKRTQDPYPDQIFASAKNIMQTYFPNNPWDLAYQSQVGDMPWLGPYTDSVLHYFSVEQKENILLVAVSFVSDHIETLVEIDQQYIPLAHQLGITHCHRAPALNTSPTFIQALTALAMTELDSIPTGGVFPDLFKEQPAQ